MLKNAGKYRRRGLPEYLKASNARASNTQPLYDIFVGRHLSEQGFEAEFAPSNIVYQDQLFATLENFSPENDKAIDLGDLHVRRGIALAYKVYAKPENATPLRKLTLVESALSLKPDKSAGLLAVGSKKGEVLEHSITRAKQVVKGDKAPLPCLAGVRVQPQAPERIHVALTKTRLVWMFPAEQIVIEGTLAQPLLDHYKKHRTTMAISYMKGELGALLDSLVAETGKHIYALDYSKFDSTICSTLIHIAFDILFSWFEECPEMDIIRRYFITTPIVMPDGNLYVGKRHGVPSGSFFTQMVDSVVNTILIGALSDAFNLGIDKKHFFCLGDDVIMSSNRRLKLDEIASFLRETFGIKLNVDKTVTGTLHFLGATWKFALPHRDVQELVNKAYQPEKYRKYTNPAVESATVLLSYATSYIEGWSILPYRSQMGRVFNDGTIDLHFNVDTIESYLTGSERYLSDFHKVRRSTFTSRCIT